MEPHAYREDRRKAANREWLLRTKRKEFFPIETLPEIEADVATKLASDMEGF